MGFFESLSKGNAVARHLPTPHRERPRARRRLDKPGPLHPVTTMPLPAPPGSFSVYLDTSIPQRVTPN